MGFNFYFASMDNNKLADYFWDNGYNLLYSNVNNRQHLAKTFNHGMTGKLFLDSGAHTAHTKGKSVDLDDYINYINTWDDKIDFYVQLDTIPGQYLKPKTQKEMEEAPELSWQNYLYMRERVANPNKLIPVFHQGEDMKWLRKMCDARFDGEPIPYIGLSPRGDVNAASKYDYCAKCFEVIENSTNPSVRTHAFGMTSLELLENLPFYSADSTTYLLVAAFGQVWTPYGKIGISVENIKHPTAAFTYWHMEKDARMKLDEYFESVGTSAEKLSVDHNERTWVSALYCKNWADNYVYKGLKSFRTTKKLF